MINFFHITYANTHYWWLLFPISLLCVTMLFRTWQMTKTIAILRQYQTTPFFAPYTFWRAICKVMFYAAGLLLLYGAILRPQWGTTEEVTSQKGRDLFIGLDISRSMLATDCAPHRIVCAKEKIKKLVSHLSCERVGLMLFSGSAFIQCPLTTDYAAFNMFVDSVDVETISSGSTALDKAISIIIESFKSTRAKKTKLLVLVTDGEDFSSRLNEVKNDAKEQNLHIITLGVGTEQGAPIPLYDERGTSIGHQKDAYGKVVISRLRPDLLTQLSNDVGGTYITLTSDNNDIKEIAQLVSAYEKEVFDDVTTHHLIDRYPIMAFASFICFALEWLL